MRRDATSKEVGHVVEIVVRGQGLEVARDTVNVTGGHAQGRRAPVEVCVHDTITLGRPARHDVIPVPRRTLNTGSFGKGDTTRILGLSPRRTSDVTRSTRRACSWGAYARLGARSRGQRYPRGPCRPPPHAMAARRSVPPAAGAPRRRCLTVQHRPHRIISAPVRPPAAPLVHGTAYRVDVSIGCSRM